MADVVTTINVPIEKPPLPKGPKEGVKYPINVVYCGECSLPLEYCEYYPAFDKCKAWLEKTLPDLFSRLYCGGEGRADDAEGDDGGKSSRV